MNTLGRRTVRSLRGGCLGAVHITYLATQNTSGNTFEPALVFSLGVYWEFQWEMVTLTGAGGMGHAHLMNRR